MTWKCVKVVAFNRSFSFLPHNSFAPTESNQIAYRRWESQVSNSARPGAARPPNLHRYGVRINPWVLPAESVKTPTITPSALIPVPSVKLALG